MRALSFSLVSAFHLSFLAKWRIVIYLCGICGLLLGQVGPEGAGHYVKMVHNGIEYGDMQLTCEAYHLMKVSARAEARREGTTACQHLLQ